MTHAKNTAITFTSFSTSPSQSDTKGTVNGFQTGSNVYLITCRVGMEGCGYSEQNRRQAKSRGHSQKTLTLSQMSCRKPHLKL